MNFELHNTSEREFDDESNSGNLTIINRCWTGVWSVTSSSIFLRILSAGEKNIWK